MFGGLNRMMPEPFPEVAPPVVAVHLYWYHSVSWLSQMIERRGEAWWRKAISGPATLLVSIAWRICRLYALAISPLTRCWRAEDLNSIFARVLQGVGLGNLLVTLDESIC